ncbi:hypothetical protein B0H10DRAFT_2087884 [Mycena sp. CBHHK59/15]|nr:hypothetical protein B0H10DRAFT_2120048 [Mycena sp. CBHHK59/15]KAJ6569966.1 hypothetical protein B0H10DRAFT_2108931 [Mycena sp. CBHHK59/15]KAJ6597311.1 hypothetical protein B0H10DRAFT_2087884 [Mycena sp. CBHHK59/15]
MSRTALSEEDSEIIAELCREVYFQKNLEWMGGDSLEKSISKLWETAAAIGVRLGREESEVAAEKEMDTMAKQLEQERVWGFDVGWKLCSELQQPRASQASLVLPSPSSPCSLSADVAVAIAAPVTASAAHAPLDWAEDSAALPTSPLCSESPPSTPRDFSALITGSPQPFASLQRRRRRSTRPVTSSSLQNHSPQKHSIRRPQKKSAIHTAPRHTPPTCSHPPPSIPFRAPTSFPPPDRPAVQFPLDWDQDPRLRDLGQALAALGWVRL